MSFLHIEIGLAHVKVLYVSQTKLWKTLRACYTMYTYVLESNNIPPIKYKPAPSNGTIKETIQNK